VREGETIGGVPYHAESTLSSAQVLKGEEQSGSDCGPEVIFKPQRLPKMQTESVSWCAATMTMMRRIVLVALPSFAHGFGNTLLGGAPLLDAANGGADCQQYTGGQSALACGLVPTAAELAADCLYSGSNPPAQACLTASKLVTGGNSDPHCGKCFKVTFAKASVSTVGCQDKFVSGICPAYTRSILVKVEDSTAKTNFEIAQNGWGGPNGLCPFVCQFTNPAQCVEDASVCAYGPYGPFSGNLPGACHSGTEDVSFQEATCP